MSKSSQHQHSQREPRRSDAKRTATAKARTHQRRIARALKYGA